MSRSSLMWLLAALLLFPSSSAYARRNRQADDFSNLTRIEARAAKGFIKQELQLAAAYFAGKGVTRDLAQSAHWYRQAADQGDPGAEVYLGYLYYAGLGVPQNTAEAVRWYQRAASANSAEAEVNLAAHYMQGDGVRQDTEEAMRLLRAASEKGYGRADAYLGWASYTGLGVPVDHAAAKTWLTRGVKRHDPEAECFLAAWDANEPGHAPDISFEARLLRLSAATGYVQAIHSLGLLLVNHPELPQAKDEAVNLLTQSANAGYWQSSAALGILAYDGRLIDHDERTAYRWLRIAVLQGGSPAETYVHKRLQRLATSLEDAGSLTLEAVAWLQAHPNHDLFVLANRASAKYFPIQEVYATAHTPAGDNEGGSRAEEPD